MLVYVLQAKAKCDDGCDQFHPYLLLGTYSSPDKVRQAIERYKKTDDWHDFISDCCDLDDEGEHS
jgi:hypothetical protein